MISTFAPSPPLAPYVIDLLAYDIRGDAPTCEPLEWVVYPDTMSIACFLFGDPVDARHKRHSSTGRRSGISGFQTHRFDVEGSGRQAGVIVRLTPCGARCLLPCSATSIVDRRVDYRDVLGHARIEALEDQLHDLATPHERVRCVEAFLLSHHRPAQLDAAMQATATNLWQAGGLASLKTLARQAELSISALERRFTRATGVGPKKFARVARLQHALKHYGHTGSWTETAAATGFADQSHLIRECHALLGESPSAHWRARHAAAALMPLQRPLPLSG